MTATNHAIMGSIVVAAVSNPVIGLPLALGSHFVLDAFPHFGAHTVAEPGSKDFNAVLKTDAVLTSSFLVLVTFAGIRAGFSWWLLPLGGILGGIPDLMWIKHYRNDINGEEKKWGKIRAFHKKIQQWELPWGWVVESVWFILSVAMLSRILYS